MLGERMLTRGRRLANARMSETVTGGSFVDGTDPETGDPTRIPDAVRYTGPGRIKYESLAVSDSSGTGSPVAAQTPFLSIPTGSPALFEGDEVVVDTSSADGVLVGRFYRVAGHPQAGQTTSNRYPLTELT